MSTPAKGPVVVPPPGRASLQPPAQPSHPPAPAASSAKKVELPASAKPDFILDLKPVDPKKHGRWCIRRWVEAEAEFQAAFQHDHPGQAVPEMPYGIMSYAWGVWHDKRKKAFGGVAGSPVSDYPTFDIGLTTTESVNGADLHNKTFPGDEKTRKVPIGTPLTWIFPVLRLREDKDNDQSAPFTINHVFDTLQKLGTRYVWWDWACFPQGWNKDFWETDKTKDARGPEFQVHVDLVAAQNRAFDSMRFFYPKSSVGCLWWHQSIWDPALALPGQKIPPITDKLKAQDGPGDRDYTTVQRMLNSIANLTALPVKGDGHGGGLLAKATHGVVHQFVHNLLAVRTHEQSLRSMWSFQEGVLFTASRRPINTQDAKAGAHNNFSVILDRNGNDMPASGDGSILRYSNVQLSDICLVAELVATVIIGPLLARTRKPTDPAPYLGSVSMAVPNYTIAFGEWCARPENDAAARLLLSKLLNTGLVGASYDSPLALFEARFGRNRESWNSDMDVFIKTIMGTLEIDFKEGLERATAAGNAYKKSNPSEQGGYARGELTSAKPDFLQAVFELYQWRMLYFARGDDFKAPGEPGYSNPFWDRIIGGVRTPFAPLSLYIGRDAELSTVYGPNRLDRAAPGDKQNNRLISGTPRLIVPLPQTQVVVIEASPKYTIYRFPHTSTAHGWAHGYCYKYVDPGCLLGENAPAATVERITLDFANRADLLFAGDIVLVPIQENVDVSAWHPSPAAAASNAPAAAPAHAAPAPAQELWTCCAILVKYNSKDSTAVFWGIGDFQDLSQSGGQDTLQHNISLY